MKIEMGKTYNEFGVGFYLYEVEHGCSHDRLKKPFNISITLIRADPFNKMVEAQTHNISDFCDTLGIKVEDIENLKNGRLVL